MDKNKDLQINNDEVNVQQTDSGNLTDDEKIDAVAKEVLEKYLPAF